MSQRRSSLDDPTTSGTFCPLAAKPANQFEITGFADVSSAKYEANRAPDGSIASVRHKTMVATSKLGSSKNHAFDPKARGDSARPTGARSLPVWRGPLRNRFPCPLGLARSYACD